MKVVITIVKDEALMRYGHVKRYDKEECIKVRWVEKRKIEYKVYGQRGILGKITV